ncbi:MAG: YncE family protein [Chitinophagales bacterium]
MKIVLRTLVTITAVIISNTIFAQNSGYHVINTFPIGGPDRWDYISISPVSGNIYVAHMDRVNILNKTTGDSIDVIPNTNGVHGIAFAPEFKEGFTSNGRSNTVTVFDINSNKFITRLKTGENPDAIMYDPFSKKVFVCDGRSKTLTIIDPYKNVVVRAIELGGKPETAVSNEAGKIYINIEDKNEIVVVNATNYIVEQRWNIGNGEEPSGLAIDIKTKRLFAGCSNKLLIVLNADNGKVVKELPIGDGCDGVAFDLVTKYVFSSNGDGTLTVIREKSAEDIVVVDNVHTKRGARTLAVDEQTHKVYLPTADFEPVNPMDPKQRPNMVAGTFQILVVSK